MIAPATISNCGPALAIMPGIALPRKPRISRIERDAQRRCDMAAAAAQHQNQQLQQPGDTDRGGDRQRGDPAHPAARTDQRDHHGDQRDVEQQRRERRQRKAALRVQQRHHHRDRPGEGEIRQHQAGIVDGELQRLVRRQSPAPAPS